MYWFATASYFNPLLAVVETSSSASCGALVTRDGARARVRAHRLARIEPEDAQPPVAGQAELDRDGAAGLGHVEHGGARGGPVVDRREEAGPTVGHLERPALAPGRVEVAVAGLAAVTVQVPMPVRCTDAPFAIEHTEAGPAV